MTADPGLVPGPDPRDGHLWTIAVTVRGAHGNARAPGVPADRYEFDAAASEYRPVQVQAWDIREALRKAAMVNLGEFLHPDEIEAPADLELSELDRLREELTVARERLGIDCDHPLDVACFECVPD